jgi:curli biogenesis system outer membrane secretion channel CsgG
VYYEKVLRGSGKKAVRLSALCLNGGGTASRTTRLYLRVLATAAAFSLVLTGCATTHNPQTANTPVTIDAAIAQASSHFETWAGEQKGKPKVAIVGFKAPTAGLKTPTTDLDVYIREELSTNLSSSGKFTVPDRDYMDKIDDELKLEAGGQFDEDTIQKIGKKTGAAYIITGKFLKTGRNWRLFVHLIKVQEDEILCFLSSPPRR